MVYGVGGAGRRGDGNGRRFTLEAWHIVGSHLDLHLWVLGSHRQSLSDRV